MYARSPEQACLRPAGAQSALPYEFGTLLAQPRTAALAFRSALHIVDCRSFAGEPGVAEEDVGHAVNRRGRAQVRDGDRVVSILQGAFGDRDRGFGPGRARDVGAVPAR